MQFPTILLLLLCSVFASDSCFGNYNKVVLTNSCSFIICQNARSYTFSNCILPTGTESLDLNACLQSCCGTTSTQNIKIDSDEVQFCTKWKHYKKSASSPSKKQIMTVVLTAFLIIPITALVTVLSYLCGCRFCKGEVHCLRATVQEERESSSSIRRNNDESIKQNDSSQSIDQNTPQFEAIWHRQQFAPESHLCSICLQESSNIVLQCGHWFHHQCIGTWMSSKNQCPNCKQTAKKGAKIYCQACLNSYHDQVEVQQMKGQIKCDKCKEMNTCIFD